MNKVDEVVSRLMLTEESRPKTREGKGEPPPAVRTPAKRKVASRPTLSTTAGQTTPGLPNSPASGNAAEPTIRVEKVERRPQRQSARTEIVDRAWLRQQAGFGASDGVAAPESEDLAAPSGQQEVHASPVHIRNTNNPRSYAVGAQGEMGRMGLSPVEMASHHTGGAGAKARLVAAIDEYLTDGITRHSAGLMRQGISPR